MTGVTFSAGSDNGNDDSDDNSDIILPPEIAAQVNKAIDDGVFLRPQQDPLSPGIIEAIIWRPGLSNELARVIIDNCTKPMRLILDGHVFQISPGQEKADDQHR